MLAKVGIFSQRSLLLETKNPDQEWPAEEPEGITLKVIKLNETTLELEPAVTISLADAASATLAQLKSALQETVTFSKIFLLCRTALLISHHCLL